MKKIEIVLYCVFGPLGLIAVGGLTYILVPQDYVVPTAWGVTALFAGLTISELREQLSGRLSELMLKHLGTPSRFREACRLIIQRQNTVRRLALLGSLVNAIGACFSLGIANTPSENDAPLWLLSLCSTLLALGLLIHTWLSLALTQVNELFVQYLQDENDEADKIKLLSTTANSPAHDFENDPFAQSVNAPIKKIGGE